MNSQSFKRLEQALHEERLDAYRRDGADPLLTLARYALNVALSESLYSALQFAEIALRNAIHQSMTARCKTDAWYDTPNARLTVWQKVRITEAKTSLTDHRKPITSGRMVAELNFGFWTGFFNKAHGQTGIGHYLASTIYPHAPLGEQDLNKLGVRWRHIRDLRNRVFHHERILHWKDLDAQHQSILEMISWISPELHEFTKKMDRFLDVRKQGLKPWFSKLQSQETTNVTTPKTIVPESFDVTNGAETTFGKRWGGDIFKLTDVDLEALQNGKTIALDVQSEYIVFLKKEVGCG